MDDVFALDWPQINEQFGGKGLYHTHTHTHKKKGGGGGWLFLMGQKMRWPYPPESVCICYSWAAINTKQCPTEAKATTTTITITTRKGKLELFPATSTAWLSNGLLTFPLAKCKRKCHKKKKEEEEWTKKNLKWKKEIVEKKFPTWAEKCVRRERLASGCNCQLLLLWMMMENLAATAAAEEQWKGRHFHGPTNYTVRKNTFSRERRPVKINANWLFTPKVCG